MLSQMAPFLSFSWTNNVCVCVCLCTTTSVFVHLLMESCFHILAVINNGATDTWVQLSFQVSVFIFFKVEFLDHLVVLFLIWGGFI